ncbi:unnamed protein product, partial [Scytosiphon promiscuus]
DASLKSEILKYRGLPIIVEEENPLAWWEERRGIFSILQDLATRFLCVPASSASSDGVCFQGRPHLDCQT